MQISFIEPAPPGFHVYSFIRQVRLGLPLLGARLRERGHDVRIFVESLSDIDWDWVLGGDLVGISTITSTAMKAYRHAEVARRAGVRVVTGGPHVTFEADEALEFSDFVVRGEGDDAILDLVEHLTNGRPLDSIPGLSYHGDGGEHRHNPDRPLRATIADLPMPDLELVDHHHRIEPTPVMTSRGCPFDCDFCSVIEMFGRKVRSVPPDRVVAAIEGSEAQNVFFYDDNFIFSKRQAKELLATMIRRNVTPEFSAQIRVDSVCKNGRVDHELLQLLREAGCYLVYLGLESANPETLQGFNKRQSVDDIAGGLEALRSYGIKTHGMFVLGSDADTLDSIDATVDFAIDAAVSSAQFLVLTPLPGTRQFARMEGQGRLLTRNWSLYDGHHVVYWPRHMSPVELQRAAIEAHQRFYRLRRLSENTKHRLEGYLISRGWERVPDNMSYLRELRSFEAAHEPPFTRTAEGSES